MSCGCKWQEQAPGLLDTIARLRAQRDESCATLHRARERVDALFVSHAEIERERDDLRAEIAILRGERLLLASQLLAARDEVQS